MKYFLNGVECVVFATLAILTVMWTVEMDRKTEMHRLMRRAVSTGKKNDTNANVTNQAAWIEEESIRTFKKELMELGTMITIIHNKEEAQ